MRYEILMLIYYKFISFAAMAEYHKTIGIFYVNILSEAFNCYNFHDDAKYIY